MSPLSFHLANMPLQATSASARLFYHPEAAEVVALPKYSVADLYGRPLAQQSRAQRPEPMVVNWGGLYCFLSPPIIAACRAAKRSGPVGSVRLPPPSVCKGDAGAA